jgi:predicted alpha/beta-hydrolase family hydrolase
MAAERVVEIDTPFGPARAHITRRGKPSALIVLGHGAGGSVEAPDLRVARDAAISCGLSVAMVEQPYRVAGRRAPAPARQLDAAWIAVVNELKQDLPVLTGGRSAGAPVACRTAAACSAVAVLCLAFPLHPPRRAAGKPPVSRLDELEQPEVPVLVVQGQNDRFGMPPTGPGREVVQVPGDHALRRAGDEIECAVTRWLSDLVESARRGHAA